MKIINIIETQGGVVSDVTSFAVHEEQLADDIYEAADNHFLFKARQCGIKKEEEEDAVGYGAWSSGDGNYDIIMWITDIED